MIGVCPPDVAAISTKILIVAVSMTSKENSELINVREFSMPKHPIIKSIIAGSIISMSNCFLYFYNIRLLSFIVQTYSYLL